MIKSLVTDDNITPNTKLVATNAVYFLGKFVSAFDKKATEKREFWADLNKDKKICDTDFMFQESDNLLYFKNKTHNFVGLKYENSDLMLLCVQINTKNSPKVKFVTRKFFFSFGKTEETERRPEKQFYHIL